MSMNIEVAYLMIFFNLILPPVLSIGIINCLGNEMIFYRIVFRQVIEEAPHHSKATAKILLIYLCGEECSDLEQKSKLTIKHYERKVLS